MRSHLFCSFSDSKEISFKCQEGKSFQHLPMSCKNKCSETQNSKCFRVCRYCRGINFPSWYCKLPKPVFWSLNYIMISLHMESPGYHQCYLWTHEVWTWFSDSNWMWCTDHIVCCKVLDDITNPLGKDQGSEIIILFKAVKILKHLKLFFKDSLCLPNSKLTTTWWLGGMKSEKSSDSLPRNSFEEYQCSLMLLIK